MLWYFIHRFLSLGKITLLLNSCAAPRFSGPPSATLKEFVTASIDCYAKFRSSDKDGPLVNCNTNPILILKKYFLFFPNFIGNYILTTITKVIFISKCYTLIKKKKVFIY